MARRVTWTGANLSITTVGVAKSFTELLGDANDEMQRGFTLLRVRGEIGLRNSVDSNALIRGTMGMIVAQAGTLTAGIPDPSIDHDADWFWYQPFVHFTPLDGAANAKSTRIWEVDGKAMRKITDHKAVFFVASSLTSPNLTYAVGLRFLFAQP